MSLNLDERNERNTSFNRFRAIMHLAMGVFYLLIGIVIVYMKYFGTIKLDPPALAYAIGSLVIVYGLFRLWRGFTDLKTGRRRPGYRS
jgi:uncharacterized membrane protein HdeD (DUF308 family)